MRLSSFCSASLRISSAWASRPYAMYTSASAIGSTSSAAPAAGGWVEAAVDCEGGGVAAPRLGSVIVEPAAAPAAAAPITLSWNLACERFIFLHVQAA